MKTKQLIESGSRTPGEMIAINQQVWETSIAEGVRQGLFGLGELDDREQPHCRFYREEVLPAFDDQEILIRSEICRDQKARVETVLVSSKMDNLSNQIAEPQGGSLGLFPTQPVQENIASESERKFQGAYNQLRIRLNLPLGNASNLLSLLNFLHLKFDNLTITIQATQGKISEDEIESKVRETFSQMGVEAEIDPE